MLQSGWQVPRSKTSSFCWFLSKNLTPLSKETDKRWLGFAPSETLFTCGAFWSVATKQIRLFPMRNHVCSNCWLGVDIIYLYVVAGWMKRMVRCFFCRPWKLLSFPRPAIRIDESYPNKPAKGTYNRDLARNSRNLIWTYNRRFA